MEFGSSGEAVLSVDASEDGTAYVLGENGTVIEFDWKTANQDELRASRKLYVNNIVPNIGPLRRIRLIGGDPICVGSAGQVYKLGRPQFMSLPALKLHGANQTIEDIAGNSSKDFVAVTSEGFGAWFDGSGWHDLNLPTNASLTSICKLDQESYVIVGKKGTIIVGHRGRWQSVSPAELARNYWGVAVSDGVVYAAHLGGIDLLRDNNLIPLDIPKAAECEFTVLRTGPDGVWSFAGQTIGFIGVDGWHTIISR